MYVHSSIWFDSQSNPQKISKVVSSCFDWSSDWIGHCSTVMERWNESRNCHNSWNMFPILYEGVKWATKFSSPEDLAQWNKLVSVDVVESRAADKSKTSENGKWFHREVRAWWTLVTIIQPSELSSLSSQRKYEWDGEKFALSEKGFIKRWGFRILSHAFHGDFIYAFHAFHASRLPRGFHSTNSLSLFLSQSLCLFLLIVQIFAG